ncbi:hypothetical protein CEE37_09120 [candidate division LCP-89 bacterium B3_LCP]|uniref:Fibronectin type-III domain-containing protein n=1 Tax=candidate division LCP-89 bacterium B3_LCP TaxID=2012998 RepID=A0A532UZT3_UNCL8|nr:MAG: hypothetical protein CEE37_09120 [candidate division LCP-89 bacterium B3_LCP]
MMFRTFAVLTALVMILSLAVVASEITIHRDLNIPEIEYRDGYHHFTTFPGPLYGEPGNPELPYVGQTVLLPPGEEVVSIQLNNEIWALAAEGVKPFPAQPPVPYSHTGEQVFTPPNQSVYNADELHPASPVSSFRTDFLSGHGIGSFSICSARLVPASGVLEALTSFDMVIQTAPTARAQNAYATMLKKTQAVNQRLAKSVDNIDLLSAYGATDNTDVVSVNYLIISSQEIAEYFQPLAEYRCSRGQQTEIVLVEDIDIQYAGLDLADKMRNCVIDYYQMNDLEYVLMAGDAEYVPKRGLFAQIGGTVDEDIPADLYFSNLDGNWNDDGDSRWGEPGEADLYSEVAVGRMAIDSEAEAENLINKIIMYENTPVVGDLEHALMLGEDLGWIVWGGENKEEIRLGSSMWGYTTVGFPPNFNVDVLYDMYSVWSPMDDLIPALNDGLHMVNHLGHCNVTYSMKLTNGVVTDEYLTNNGINHNFYIPYSQGCYNGSFDNRTTNYTYSIDCIAEEFTTIQNGAVAYLCNSRYGWGSYSSTGGPSQYYDRQYYDAIFSEEIYSIGWVNADSKEDNVPFLSQGATYWVYYEMNLLGDPAMDIWTASPQSITATHPGQIEIGTTQLSVSTGVPYATVAVSREDEVLGSGTANASGTILLILEEPISEAGELSLTAYKHNYLPYQGVIYAVPESGPYMYLTSVSYSDASGGNDDGNADLGETLDISADFMNIGYDPAVGIDAFLTCNTCAVSIIDGVLEVGDLGSMEAVEFEEAFTVQLLPSVQDGQVLPFIITLEDNQGSSWEYYFEVTAYAPQLQMVSHTITDTNDNWMTPGETGNIEIEIINNGTGGTTDLEFWLSTDNALATANPQGISADALASGESSAVVGFEFSIDPSMPDPSSLVVYITARDSRDYEKGFLIELPVGGYYDSMESGVGEWTHSSITPGFDDQWGMTELLNHTQNGNSSWHCGNEGLYTSNLDAALVTPEYTIDGCHQLQFHQWMNAEVASQTMYDGYAHDGGIVEMSYNGGDFEQIIPRGGYPFLIRDNGSPMPFAPETPVFSGQILWEEAIFDIEGQGTVQFRFRFGTNGDITLNGWFLDDLFLVKTSDPNPPTNVTIVNASAGVPEVVLTWNTPDVEFLDNKGIPGSRPSQTLEEYRVYRNGVFIDSVQALTYNDNLSYLEPGTYFYQVSGVFDGVEGSLSAPASYQYTSVEPETQSAVPTDTELSAAYPNPFNPVVNLRLDIATPQLVRLTVYDLLGRKVGTLHDGQMMTGRYTISWDASGQSSGMYFIRMETESYEGFQKVLLLK